MHSKGKLEICVFHLIYLKIVKMLGTQEDNELRLLRDLQMAQDKLALDVQHCRLSISVHGRQDTLPTLDRKFLMGKEQM